MIQEVDYVGVMLQMQPILMIFKTMLGQTYTLTIYLSEALAWLLEEFVQAACGNRFLTGFLPMCGACRYHNDIKYMS